MIYKRSIRERIASVFTSREGDLRRAAKSRSRMSRGEADTDDLLNSGVRRAFQAMLRDSKLGSESDTQLFAVLCKSIGWAGHDKARKRASDANIEKRYTEGRPRNEGPSPIEIMIQEEAATLENCKRQIRGRVNLLVLDMYLKGMDPPEISRELAINKVASVSPQSVAKRITRIRQKLKQRISAEQLL